MKKILTLSLIILFLSVQYMPIENVYATSSPSAQDKAVMLKNLGLFSGTSTGFDLDRAPSRAEAAVMLVRLLGKDSTAKSQNFSHPFTDVSDWANPYVGYLYKYELTKGKSATTFDSMSDISALQYITFVLRALGYDDSKGDFNLSTSLNKAKDIGLIDDEHVSRYKDSLIFLRSDVVDISFNALKCKIKNSDTLLAVRLIYEDNAIPEDLAIRYGLISKDFADNRIPPRGNIKGNLYTTIWKDCIYFLNPTDHMYLYKMKSDGTQVTKLAEITGDQIGTAQDTIYLRMLDSSDKKYKIFKVDLSGRHIEKICDDEVGYFIIFDGLIYYTNKTDGIGIDQTGKVVKDLTSIKDKSVFSNTLGKLYKMKLNGTDKNEVIGDNIGIKEFDISKKYIIYSGLEHNSTFYDNSDALYQINIDGTDGTYGSNPITLDFLSGIVEYKNYVYYGIGKAVPNGKLKHSAAICKKSPDNPTYWSATLSGGFELRYNTQVVFRNEVSNLILSNDCIYFKSPCIPDDINGQIYKININDTNLKVQQVTNDSCYYFDIIGDWVFYETNHNSQNPCFYRIKVDGTGKEILENNVWKSCK